MEDVVKGQLPLSLSSCGIRDEAGRGAYRHSPPSTMILLLVPSLMKGRTMLYAMGKTRGAVKGGEGGET